MPRRYQQRQADSSDSENENDNITTTNRRTNTNNTNGGDTPTTIDLPILHNDDTDTLRIMISTDNHLGYAERDPVRGMDSFAAFEEVLYLAKRYHCDMVVIAGDLFHDNRPSRRTIHKTMEIIRRYCLGPNPVQIQILSNQQENFRNPVSNVVNYQDPNYSIDLPIFSIHGNHDDPSRDAGGELLAALDLLSVSNLVNYWGRQDQVDKVEISPVLLQKGKTKVALYGLGSMRDERLNRMWDSKKVRFLRPEEDDDNKNNNEEKNDNDDNDDDNPAGFFNIFALHQNRDLGRGSKNCIQESMIPEWMDLVIWGHEHECLIEFFESVVGTFRITQPGSSVATSLVPGEAARKKVGILDINRTNFRLHPVPLTQVRSFVTAELSLREHRSNLDPEDPKIDTKLTQALVDEVNMLILAAREKTTELIRDARLAGNDAADNTHKLKYSLAKPDEVLVRIRVEHSGFSTMNNQRFGARFVGQLANANDVLLFHRKKDPKVASTAASSSKKFIQPIAPEELERTNMEDLVKEHLGAPERKLKLLEESELCEAMEDYVEKSMAAAIPDKAHSLLKKKQAKLIKGQSDNNPTAATSSQLRNVLDDSRDDDTNVTASRNASALNESSSTLTAAASTNKRKYGVNDSVASSVINNNSGTLDDDDDEDKISEPPKKGARQRAATARGKAPARARKAATGVGRKKPLENEFSDDDGLEDDEPQPTKGRGRPKRATATKKVNYSVSDNSENEELSDVVEYDDENENTEDHQLDNDDVSIEEVSPPKQQRGKRKAPEVTRKTAPAMRQRSTSGTAQAKPTPSRGRKATSTRKYHDDSDDEDLNPKRGRGGGGGGGTTRRNTKKAGAPDEFDDDLDIDWGTALTKSQN